MFANKNIKTETRGKKYNSRNHFYITNMLLIEISFITFMKSLQDYNWPLVTSPVFRKYHLIKTALPKFSKY